MIEGALIPHTVLAEGYPFLPRYDIEVGVVGEGNIGEKAGQLIEKTAALRELGFHTPPRVVLTQGFLEDFLERNKLGDLGQEGVSQADILKGSFTAAQFRLLRALSDGFTSPVLAVRSSAGGDARGTGVYRSNLVERSIFGIKNATRKVLASYYSESAQEFRAHTQTAGMGIIVEPIIGQSLDKIDPKYPEYQPRFGPLISGFGYTSTANGEGYVNVVPGIGGGVETRDGERITREKWGDHYNLMEYILDERGRMIHGFNSIKQSALLGMSSGRILDEIYDGVVFFPKRQYQPSSVERTCFGWGDRWLHEVRDVNLSGLFDLSDQMELAFGSPQYFEWAMTAENGEPKYWIVQIADVDRKIDSFEFEDPPNVIYEGHSVTKSGEMLCSKIVFCDEEEDLRRLREFNRNNKGYALIFSSLATSGGGYWDRSIQYADCSNASVLIERQENTHVSSGALGHLKGLMDMTDKFFGVFQPFVPSEESTSKMAMIHADVVEEDGLRVYQKPVKVLSSLRQNRMVISSIDEEII